MNVKTERKEGYWEEWYKGPVTDDNKTNNEISTDMERGYDDGDILCACTI